MGCEGDFVWLAPVDGCLTSYLWPRGDNVWVGGSNQSKWL